MGHVTRSGLACVEPFYKAALACRNAAFQARLRTIHRLPKPVISVGNLTVGGTGKTPMVIELAQRLRRAGHHPAVLLRGYKADSSGSDEANVYIKELGDATPVEADPDRVAAARRVMATAPETDVFLLDDGFQHRRVHRDLDLLLIDATEPFGLGHVLPRGRLREPIHHLRRAHCVIVTRCDQCSDAQLQSIDHQIQQISPQLPIVHAAFQWTGLRDALGREHPLETLLNARVIGVCGIGNPRAFEQNLRRHAGFVVAQHALADHHHYTGDQIRCFLDEAMALRANAIVMTEKDWVKWQPLLGQSPLSTAVFRSIQRVQYLDGGDVLDRLVLRGVAPRESHTDR